MKVDATAVQCTAKQEAELYRPLNRFLAYLARKCMAQFQNEKQWLKVKRCEGTPRRLAAKSRCLIRVGARARACVRIKEIEHGPGLLLPSLSVVVVLGARVVPSFPLAPGRPLLRPLAGAELPEHVLVAAVLTTHLVRLMVLLETRIANVVLVHHVASHVRVLVALLLLAPTALLRVARGLGHQPEQVSTVVARHPVQSLVECVRRRAVTPASATAAASLHDSTEERHCGWTMNSCGRRALEGWRCAHVRPHGDEPAFIGDCTHGARYFGTGVSKLRCAFSGHVPR